mmetsp:Transcript_25298/g.33012  ORF Transcript_25298/g.33012 Transcript_25298/m.33012 type:complete len:90 (+) Transcript_25298:1376-1645(+)
MVHEVAFQIEILHTMRQAGLKDVDRQEAVGEEVEVRQAALDYPFELDDDDDIDSNDLVVVNFAQEGKLYNLQQVHNCCSTFLRGLQLLT